MAAARCLLAGRAIQQGQREGERERECFANDMRTLRIPAIYALRLGVILAREGRRLSLGIVLVLRRAF